MPVVRITAGHSVLYSMNNGFTMHEFDDGEYYEVPVHVAAGMLARGWAQLASLPDGPGQPREPEPPRKPPAPRDVPPRESPPRRQPEPKPGEDEPVEEEERTQKRRK